MGPGEEKISQTRNWLTLTHTTLCFCVETESYTRLGLLSTFWWKKHILKMCHHGFYWIIANCFFIELVMVGYWFPLSYALYTTWQVWKHFWLHLFHLWVKQVFHLFHSKVSFHSKSFQKNSKSFPKVFTQNTCFSLCFEFSLEVK